MRITKIETLRVDSIGNMLWLRLSTDAGITGLGEAFRNAGATEAYIHETLAPWLLGKDPLEINAHREAIGRRIGNRFMGTPSRSIEIRGNAAVDLALWDILGKHKLSCYSISNHLVGQCVCDHIDARHESILFSATDVWGDACSGEVTVAVPHDGRGAPAVDDGPAYDSTALAP